MDSAARFLPMVLAMFVAGEISGMTGFGVGVVGSISLAILVGPKLAVILLSILSTFTAINQVVRFRHEFYAVRRLVSLLVAALLGAAAGSYLLIKLPYGVLATLLGVFTLTYVTISLMGYRPSVSPAAERLLSPAVGLVAGVVNSTVGSSGPILGPYLLALGFAPATFIVCISTTFLVTGTVRVVTLAALGAYTWPVVAAGLALVVPTFCGQLVGFWLQKKVPRHVFERLILLLLAVAAVYLVYRGVMAML